MKKFDIKNIDFRKLAGTVIGGVFFVVCILYFTYAYYEWKSDNTNVTLAINDLSMECLPGPDVNVTDIGPVLNYQDGVKSQFTINNDLTDEIAIDLRIDITDVSSNLLTESFKYAVVTDTTGNTNYDYNNPVLVGDFTNFVVGSNVLTTDLSVEASTEQKFLFIVYIDGNMKNDINMQDNSLEANLMIGNCDENALPMDKLVYQAIYSSDDNSLTFVHTRLLKAGDTYNNKAVTNVYTGFETANYTTSASVPWFNNRENITNVNFDSVIKPKSTARWFASLSNLISIDLTNLDTSNVLDMSYMFAYCYSLVNLDLSNFDTSKVTTMYRMFTECKSLKELQISGFNTNKVTTMYHMFSSCESLTSLDVSNFDTSNVTSMEFMFNECSSLVELDLSNFNTSKTTTMFHMFSACSNLEKLDLSNFNTNKVTTMEYMFSGCSSLVELDLSNFYTSSLNNMKRMFYNCSSLTSLDLSNFDTSKVTTMYHLFDGCVNLISVELDNWDFSSLTDIQAMFYNCNKLVLVITVNSLSITTYTSMFNGAATASGAQITINYITDDPATSDVNESTEALVDNMIATKSSNSNITKGCYGNNCPV